MPFTVTRSEETSDAEFVEYIHKLLQQGRSLANLPRVPDPENPHRRWTGAFETQDEAQKFVDDLLERTVMTGWRIEPIVTEPSFGPFGPVLIEQARVSDGLFLSLHPLSLPLIREAFPETKRAVTQVFVESDSFSDYKKKHGTFSELVREILPLLTGLCLDQLTDVGYVVIDADDHRTTAYLPPFGVTQDSIGDQASGRNGGRDSQALRQSVSS